MAAFLKVSVATIKDIENKNHIPNIGILKGIEKLFPELKNILDEMIVSKNTNMKKETGKTTSRILYELLTSKGEE